MQIECIGRRSALLQSIGDAEAGLKASSIGHRLLSAFHALRTLEGLTKLCLSESKEA